jgi:3-oxoacyl-[acyl-carrier-protein] synthase II
MTEDRSVIITGLGIELPGLSQAEGLLELLTSKPAIAEAAPEGRIGTKGLRYKDRATKLALAAAMAALEHAGLPLNAAEQLEPEMFGAIASSNLGNLDTVCRAVEAIRASSVDATSPMDLPNASSNVISASLAIWFGLGAVNVTICNGATSGTEALYLAANAIRSGRAKRMVVVGVETVNAPVERLLNESARAWLKEAQELRLGECAGAVVLESAAAARVRNAAVYGRVGAYGYAAQADVRGSLAAASRCDQAAPDFWLTPNCSYGSTAAQVEAAARTWKGDTPRMLDMAVSLGETYGATGVLQAIAACLWLRANQGAKAIATSGAAWGDGAASLVIRS